MADLVDLTSEEGQRMLNDVFTKGKFNQPLLQGIFSKQIGRKNCGIQTCALLMGAAQLGESQVEANQPGKTFTPPIAESRMFEYPQTLQVTNQQEVDVNGLSLESVQDVLTSHGFSVKSYFANESSVEEFREEAKKALGNNNSKTGVVVNYDMPTLGQGKHLGGHHSPLGAYHETSDSFLILDTWPETKECWATSSAIYAAMNTQDSSTDKSRGFCVVQF